MSEAEHKRLQKMLMAQWRRETLGFQFDPEPQMDIRWEEEFSSCDYDSEDLHSSVDSDSSSDEASTDFEDDFDAEQPDMYVIEDATGSADPAAAKVSDGAEETATAGGSEENAELPVDETQPTSGADVGNSEAGATTDVHLAQCFVLHVALFFSYEC